MVVVASDWWSVEVTSWLWWWVVCWTWSCVCFGDWSQESRCHKNHPSLISNWHRDHGIGVWTRMRFDQRQVASDQWEVVTWDLELEWCHSRLCRFGQCPSWSSYESPKSKAKVATVAFGISELRHWVPSVPVVFRWSKLGCNTSIGVRVVQVIQVMRLLTVTWLSLAIGSSTWTFLATAPARLWLWWWREVPMQLPKKSERLISSPSSVEWPSVVSKDDVVAMVMWFDRDLSLSILEEVPWVSKLKWHLTWQATRISWWYQLIRFQ